jgi:hypothetical protein
LSSAISDPGFEFLITEILVLPDLKRFKSETLTKSMLLANPNVVSLPFRPVKEAGTAPVAISAAPKLLPSQ